MDHEQLCERVAELGARVDNLEGWQKRQNGSLQSMDAKMDGVCESMATFKTDVYKWLMGITGGIAVSLFLLLVNLAMGLIGGK